MSSPPPTPPEISIVIPAYNERENVSPLLAELRAALQLLSRTHEIVLVDDGSDDGTAGAIAEEARQDPNLRAVLLRPHSGQSGALAAGIARARGSIVVTLDADLQNDPADLPAVLAALEGADVVSGVRVRRNDPWLRRVSSSIANGARRMVLGDSISDIGCSFKAYRRPALEGIPWFVGVHRFLPALCELRGARLVEVPLRHRARRFGASKYGVSNRLWRGLRDLLGAHWLKSRLIHYRHEEDDR